MSIAKTNLYAYDDILLEDIPWGKEPDYIYANPSIYDIGNNYMVVVNEEGSQLELIDSSSGLLKSIHVSTDMELISHIENILEFYIKSKENEAKVEANLEELKKQLQIEIRLAKRSGDNAEELAFSEALDMIENLT